MAAVATFGQVIKHRRRALDMTQRDLANQVGYSVVTIRKVETDERRPSRELAERLAHCLRIDPEQQGAFVGLGRLEPVPATRSNLPAPLTRLIGRQAEVDLVRDTVMRRGVRIVTLVGPPGIGKSRLSVEVAGELRTVFPDGVCFVAFAPVGDEALVVPTLATALGVREVAGTPLADVLVEHLRDRRLLLLLDDCEHLLGAARCFAELLTACPELRILATSRAPLHIRGERLVPVPPLALPSTRHDPTAETVLRSAAVELFVERAAAVDPAFRLTDANAGDVAAICAGVDGLPLAIELVAARVALLSTAAILARLNHRLTLLTDGPRDLPERQQTLRRTIDWSYDLLEPGEQLLFARLAVFTGGFCLSAAEAVMDLDAATVLDGVTGLVDKNLLRQEVRADGERYADFFEMIREYALERLVASGEQDRIRDRHARYYLALAEQETDLDRLGVEHNNLRGALEWHIQRDDADAGLRLVAALWKFWHIRSHHTEASRWVTLVMHLSGEHDPAVRAHVLCGAGWIAVDRSDHVRAKAYFDESLALFRELGDPRGVAEALHGVGTMLQASGGSAEALALFEESLVLYRDLDDTEGIAWTLDHLGQSRLGLPDAAGAEALFEASRALFQRLGHAWGRAITLDHLGLADLAQGNHARAAERFGEALGLFDELANTWGIATSFEHLGHAALAAGDAARSRDCFRRSLQLTQAEADRAGIVRSLAGLASLAVVQRQSQRAAQLFGALALLAEGGGTLMNPVERAISDHLAVVHRDLDHEAMARAWARGARMTLAEAVAYATDGA
ncbi:tetratricopeptide repeat protein [Dactylosporangium aurantiacum]|uniref:Tetratricopeptide repeat protein n=1 Tax=Dactylosporangium aurantiacum TaxID=35754 RepID=A0A9Q9M9P8_9ACTN|nr:tetratricopeptide repeat protein [Dactylosporangium aurantiacum]MDG6106826.1 tetratricopeptide repeat protein [Dactylosporangium aurantiacum]UWZ50963.1 tetratricopeptide repeat protein [Dactylosporangium aurantiacum]